MRDYFSTEIRIFNFDKNPVGNSINNLQSYLEINGKPYYQNMDNPKRKEFHYFMGNSVVFIKQYPTKANIKIITSNQNVLSRMRSKVEKILAEEPF